jgi:hypothetical protein
MRPFGLVAKAALLGVAIIATEGMAQKEKSLGPKYFPKGTFKFMHSDGSFAAGWYASQLAAMKEEPLMGRSEESETVYRFLLLPSFSHGVAVRLTLHSDGTGTAVTRVLGGKGGYAPGKVTLEKSRNLSPAEAAQFQNQLESAKFWKTSTEPGPDSPGGCDGTEWVMEGAKGGKYHVVDRWEGGALRGIGSYMLKTVGQAPDADKALE